MGAGPHAWKPPLAPSFRWRECEAGDVSRACSGRTSRIHACFPERATSWQALRNLRETTRRRRSAVAKATRRRHAFWPITTRSTRLLQPAARCSGELAAESGRGAPARAPSSSTSTTSRNVKRRATDHAHRRPGAGAGSPSPARPRLVRTGDDRVSAVRRATSFALLLRGAGELEAREGRPLGSWPRSKGTSIRWYAPLSAELWDSRPAPGRRSRRELLRIADEAMYESEALWAHGVEVAA